MKLISPLFAVLMLFVVGCSRPADKSPDLGDIFDYGEPKNNTYHNKFLGFTISLPPNWKLDADGMQKHADERKKYIDGGGKDVPPVCLFFVTKYPVGAVPVNSAISCSVFDCKD